METLLSYETVIMSLFLGIGIAASSGFRVFLPLFILSLAAYFNIVTLSKDWLWFGSLTVVVSLGVATVVEILAYLIPWLDNMLDTIATPLAAIAGTLAIASTLINMNPYYSWALAIIAGAGAATTVKASNSGMRLLSTASTGGAANPLFSVIETVISGLLTILSIFIPILAFILVIILFFFIITAYKKMRKKLASNEVKSITS